MKSGWINFDLEELCIDKKEVEKSKMGRKRKSEEFSKSVKGNNKENLAAKKGRQPVFKKFDFEKDLAPKTKEDLAVHSKKIQEVEAWLTDYILNRQSNKEPAILVICGPTGSGKTATVQVLCKQLGIELAEWINPLPSSDDFKGPGQISRLIEFISEAKYPSLMSFGQNGKVVLVEDFPNTAINNPEEFETVLEKCQIQSNLNIIFICTDSGSTTLNIAQTLFPDDIRQKYSIGKITFNSCATTIMKSAIKRMHSIISKHSDLFKVPNQSTVDAIVASSLGDICSATNQYHMACLKGMKDVPTVEEVVDSTSTTKRKKKQTISKIKSMARDETLGLFHSIGRVLNPKRKETENGWRIQCDLNSLIDEFSTHPTAILGFLQENYLKYFGDIDDVSNASNILSESQVLMKDFYSSNFDSVRNILWMTVMGLMISNEHRVTGFNPIKGPTKIKKTTYNELEERYMDATDRYFYNVLNKTDKYHMFK